MHRYQNEKVTSLLDLTSILDPRFKVKYVRNVEVWACVKEEGANYFKNSVQLRTSQLHQVVTTLTLL